MHDDRLLYQYQNNPLLAGLQLWETDGTPQGTLLVDPGEGGLLDSTVEAAIGDSFVAPISRGIVLIDREEFSRTIVDLEDVGSSLPYGFLETPNHVFFSVAGSDNVVDVWSTDGTSEGTNRIADFERFSNATPATGLTWFHDQLFFSADHALWSYAPATTTLREVYRFPEIGPLVRGGTTRQLGPDAFTVYEDHLIFAANSSEFGHELWITDGTPDGTRLLTDIAPGPANAYPSDLALWGDQLLFAATHPDVGNELWSLDLLLRRTAIWKLASTSMSFHSLPVPGTILGSQNRLTTRSPNRGCRHQEKHRLRLPANSNYSGRHPPMENTISVSTA